MNKSRPYFTLSGQTFYFDATVEGLMDFIQNEYPTQRFIEACALQYKYSVDNENGSSTEQPVLKRFYLLGKISQGLNFSKDDLGDLRAILSGAIERTEKIVKATGGRTSWSDNPAIVFLVLMATASGASIFRNDLSGSLSACDMVAEALRRLEMKPTSYSGVKNAYLENRKRLDIWLPEK